MSLDTPVPWAVPAAVLTESGMLRLVTHLCQEVGLACDDAALPQQPVTNAAVVLPTAGLVARVSSRAARERMLREIQVADWLDACGIPVALPAAAPPYPQAEFRDGYAVTWWQYLPQVSKAPGSQVCAIAARIHRLRPPPGLLPRFDPFPAMRREIEQAVGMPRAEREQMHQVADALAERWRASHWATDRPVILHGDVHGTNIVNTALGVRVLDLEDVSLGPWQWDLAWYLAGREIGWVKEAELEEAIAAYGRDPREAPDIDLLVQVRLARMSTLVAAVTARSPHLAEQARMRMASVTDPDLRTGWWWGDWHG